ncbi:MAG: hypothetical protein Fur0046_36880 [Cyanobacteria bacterium J069]|nr:MAG: calcium-binding protein [Cyanobacteria bacterium J069]
MDSQTDLLAASLTDASAVTEVVTEVILGSGNDTVFTATEHVVRTVYKGGLGTDRISLVLTSEQLQALISAEQFAALKRYISSPTDQRLDLSVLNFSAEEFEAAALYIQEGDRLISISTDALLNTEDTVIGVPIIEAPPPEAAPTEALPPEASPPEALPPEALPLEAPPPEALPPEAISLETTKLADGIVEATLPEETRAIAAPLTLAVPDSTLETATLVGQPNVNTLFIATETAYVVEANSGDDFIYTGDADDLIYTGILGAADIDQVWAGAGNDTIVLSGGADTIYGEAGDDLFLFNVPDYANSGDLDGDTIYGGSGIDTIRNDTAGADIFIWQINNFYQFNTSTWISGVEVFDGNGGAVIGDAIRTNYLVFSAFETVINVPFVRTGDNYDLVDASTFATGVEIHTQAGNDVIIGSAGNDTLVGGGGDDALTGGSGQDIFQLNAPGLGVDYITDFTPGVDKLRIVASEFDSFQRAGVLEASRFALGVAARTPNHRIIYNPLNGDLLYDANGAGDGVAPVQIAILPLNLSLTRSDIVVVS